MGAGAAQVPGRGRLGVYVDDVYRVGDVEGRTGVSTDRAFLLFVCEVGRYFEKTVLLGRTVRSDEPADYRLPTGVDVVELPHYANLVHVREVLGAAIGTSRGMWRGLASVDTIWVFGPHPFAILLVLLALLRGKRVVLGVRQDTLAYHKARLGGRRRHLLLAVRAMDAVFRAFARRLPTTVVGPAIAESYGGERDSLIAMTVALVREVDIAVPAERDWTATIELLTVGRVEPEKNPRLLVESLAALQRVRPGGFALRWIGRGSLEAETRALADRLGVELTLEGYVPFGPELLGRYRSAHAFVHVSLTEGVPQVLVEALAQGTPVVGTDVGGVRSVLDDGRAGLLVPPGDRDALVGAIQRITNDEELRERLVARGLELARERTLERESARVARFLVSGSAPVERPDG